MDINGVRPGDGILPMGIPMESPHIQWVHQDRLIPSQILKSEGAQNSALAEK